MQLSKSMAKEWNQLLDMKSCYIGNMTGCFSETNWWSPSLQQCQFVAEATDDLELTESIMCRLKILLSRIVSQHLVLCLDQSRSQILKNNHRKHPHEEHLLKKKVKTKQKTQFIFLWTWGHLTSASSANTHELTGRAPCWIWIPDRTWLLLLSIQTCQIWDHIGLKYAGDTT